ncbi:hypothetical protein [Glaciimonas sp. PAMC28666]|uniref:hypothetical protein n=1 Tax=Glaciimonas sp. PAMC28666 TaxID=2807626 RepID=UPI00196423F2|nr:hypothetical protein [Glaciimonas sp. PAMC28666]QRX83698.1 hypothetical protein JQN73_05585 [Glaciimonas sp. PAMC28666]
MPNIVTSPHFYLRIRQPSARRNSIFAANLLISTVSNLNALKIAIALCCSPMADFSFGVTEEIK